MLLLIHEREYSLAWGLAFVSTLKQSGIRTIKNRRKHSCTSGQMAEVRSIAVPRIVSPEAVLDLISERMTGADAVEAERKVPVAHDPL
jgi:hypothetical protein